MSCELDKLIYDEAPFEAYLRNGVNARADVDSDSDLLSQDAELREAFHALAAMKCEDAPNDLARILSRAGAAEAASPPPLRVTTADANLADNSRVIQLHGLRDIIAVAAMIVLGIGVGVPGLLQMKHRENRIACAANLAQLGQGFSSYASIFDSQLPFVGWNSSTSWAPATAPGVEVTPNRGHLFPLVVTRQVENPRFFVCPASKGDVPVSGDELRAMGGFPEARNISYAYQNMAGQRPRVETSLASLPILGDDNPLFDNGVPLLDSYAHRLGLRDLARGNSQAHGGAGQNVLTVDGSAKWFSSPMVGVSGDNIWTLEGVEHYTGREGPQAMTDAHLLK